MSDRTAYFLDPKGQRVIRLPGEHDHADIGRRVLASHSATSSDYADIYHQMHRLGYARVVDYHDIAQIHAENDRRKFTQAQMDFLRAHALELKYRLVLNNRPNSWRHVKAVPHLILNSRRRPWLNGYWTDILK